jgi:hypothetical protein
MLFLLEFWGHNTSSYSGYLVFVSTSMCCVMTDCRRMSPMYSCIDLHIEMSGSCTFFVLMPLLRREELNKLEWYYLDSHAAKIAEIVGRAD